MTPVAGASVSGSNFADFGVHLAVDAVAVVILAVGIYLPRHARRDLMTAMVCFNVALFVVLATIDVRSTDVGVGFGLFALLSIITLRSETFSTIELGYLFVAIVVGVVNALEVGGRFLDWRNEGFAALLTAVALVAVYAADHPRLSRATGHQQVTLDRVHADPALLRADLEERLHVTVTSASVLHTDYVAETMLVDVRYRHRPAASAAPRGPRGTP
ncbi:DUF4956 domain-containing protein [Nocardioides sp. DS6]|uniref:DUF4956 domain-containing protein n=1 Tax=Nocardioides eburneus TaxID=3231482 RepID=A0ABV3SZT1_9ACTN